MKEYEGRLPESVLKEVQDNLPEKCGKERMKN
jgi:hypothetical protein